MYTHLSGKVAGTWESISEMMDCEKVHAYQTENSSDLQNAEVINLISIFMGVTVYPTENRARRSKMTCADEKEHGLLCNHNIIQ